MNQSITQQAPIVRTPSERYEKLLQERITIGRLYVDALCHQATLPEAERLFMYVQRLDCRLDRFRRYSHDQTRIITPAEDDRWHVPDEPPAGPECRLCIEQDLRLLFDLALVPVPRQSAQPVRRRKALLRPTGQRSEYR